MVNRKAGISASGATASRPLRRKDQNRVNMLLNWVSRSTARITRRVRDDPYPNRPHALFPTMVHYNFKRGWVPALAAVLLFPIFVSLGIWQLHRAEEKEKLISLHADRHQAGALPLGVPDFPPLDEIRYRHVVVEGRYDQAHQILLDNQIADHQAGYFVLTPFKSRGGGHLLLINRGWVPAGRSRSELPDVAVGGEPTRVRGVIDTFPSVAWRLRGAEIPSAGWPAVVQLLDAAALSRHLGDPVVPYQVLLDPAEPEGYRRNWTADAPNPGKNRGYALQWFAFAAILVVLFIRFGFKPKTAVPLHQASPPEP